jgi:hypothetical protein
MTEINRHGLSRDIPDPIKREIRRKCGFGCVCCGLAIASYEHIDPEFADAREHDPARMAYLCEGCHSRVTRRFWSKDRVVRAAREPYCLVNPNRRFWDKLDVSAEDMMVQIGGVRCVKVPILLNVKGDDLLFVEPPEEPGAPFRISARFYDLNEQEIFRIDRNEWSGPPTNWDVECVGGRITIRSSPWKIALRLLIKPPKELIVERIDMAYRGERIVGNDSVITMSGASLVGPCDVVGSGSGALLSGPAGPSGGFRMSAGDAGPVTMTPR